MNARKWDRLTPLAIGLGLAIGGDSAGSTRLTGQL